ncbi:MULTISPECIES: phosphotransferase enzyme family protein [unclassified Saccharibacter]|uniref:phosphotransferase enzyme family protein n=1 Tax=unclassified Saccharibacter TaxID=2648722 RepID=UPI00132ABE8B|nr:MULTISPECIES: phosphotransferase [unclassified Saccharibacter]MXV36745.1 phosphotransferase [Saccharibacter sp. EH611]MXV58237.1 phosphotransferase [Saccharibacter sp. EH70]MXV65693.1 phosphotransferase [Saccharibacter sp. EH60]
MSIALGIDESHKVSDWPPLQEHDIRHVLKGFGLSPAAHRPISWQSERPFSSAGIIRLDDGYEVFIKRHDYRLRPADSLTDEHRFIEHLLAEGLPVCAPLRDHQQLSTLIAGNGVFEVFPLLKGDDLYHTTRSWEPYHNIQHAASAGAMLARLHQASSHYHAPSRSPCLLTSCMEPLLHEDLGESLRHWVLTQPGLSAHLPANWLDELLPLVTPFHQHFLSLRDCMTPLWGHGDWHGSNLTWHRDHVYGIFDFGMSNLSCAEFDLAVALERSFIRWMAPNSSHPIAYEQIEHFLDAYNHHCPRTAARNALVASLLPLCHITFALSEIAYYGYLLGDQAHADIAYHGYLLGHARWFHSSAGQGLLYALAPYA